MTICPGRAELYETVRPVHHLIERFGRRQAGQHYIGLRADLGRGPRWHTADLLECGERGAPETDDPMSALDQIFRDRHPHLADADEPDCFHDRFPDRFPVLFLCWLRS